MRFSSFAEHVCIEGPVVHALHDVFTWASERRRRSATFNWWSFLRRCFSSTCFAAARFGTSSLGSSRSLVVAFAGVVFIRRVVRRRASKIPLRFVVRSGQSVPLGDELLFVDVASFMIFSTALHDVIAVSNIYKIVDDRLGNLSSLR